MHSENVLINEFSWQLKTRKKVFEILLIGLKGLILSFQIILNTGRSNTHFKGLPRDPEQIMTDKCSAHQALKG